MTAEGDSLGGQAVAVLNQELRFPIWKRLHGGVFWDAGNVWLTSGQLALGDLRQSVGAGLRVHVPVRADPRRVRLGPEAAAGRAEGPLRLRPRPRVLARP